MRTAETVWVDDTTFFNKPKEELLRETIAELREFTFASISDMIDIPQKFKGYIKYDLTDPSYLRQWAEKVLKDKYRLPSDIPTEQIVPVEERKCIIQCIASVDNFSRQKTDKWYNLWRGKEFRAGHIVLRDENHSLAITLNSFNHLQPWYLTSSLFLGFPDPVYRWNWKDGSSLFLTRSQDGHVISYSVKDKGEQKPQTPWNYMVKEDVPTIYEVIQRGKDLIRKYIDGNIECYIE